MFDKLDKFSSEEEMNKYLGKCPFCNRLCDISGTYYRKIYHFVCKDDRHHYECRAMQYRYARKIFWRLAKERLDIHGLNIFIARDWDWGKRRSKAMVKIYERSQRNAIKKYSTARFAKLFNPSDPDFFVKKLETISKAVALMK